VDLVGDVLPRELADRNREAVVAGGSCGQCQDMCACNVTDVDDVARSREIALLLRAVEEAPHVLDRGVQLVGGGYIRMLAKSCRSQVVPDKLTDLVDDRAEDEGRVDGGNVPTGLVSLDKLPGGTFGQGL
jgi:hypothetical protein